MTDTPESTPNPIEAIPQTAGTLQAIALQSVDAVAAGLADLRQQYTGVVYPVTTTAGMAEARKARAAIRDVRYAVENARKAVGSELKQVATAVNRRAEEITNAVFALEAPIDAQIKGEEERKEAAREAERKAEQERLDLLGDIRDYPLRGLVASVEKLDELTAALRALPLTAFPEGDNRGQVEVEKALASLDVLRADRVERDRQQAEYEENARREAAEAQQRREAEERERAQRQAEEDRLRAEQAERDRQAREAEEQRLAAERAELERQQAEVRRQQDELAAQQAAEREAAERAEAERQAQERARAEEAERRRAEQERQHHEAAVEAATLREAANEALELLRQFVGEDNLTVRKLVAALNRAE